MGGKDAFDRFLNLNFPLMVSSDDEDAGGDSDTNQDAGEDDDRSLGLTAVFPLRARSHGGL
jgi:hypothetical protein